MLRKGHILAVVVIGVSVTAFLSISAQQNYDIPAWVKGVAGFWAEDKISDQEFGEGLSFLIDNEIIKIPKIQSLQNEITRLESENKNFRGDMEFLEKENAQLENDVSRLEGKLLYSEIIATQEQYTPVINAEKNGEVRIYFKPIPTFAYELTSVEVATTYRGSFLQSLIDEVPHFANVNGVNLKVTDDQSKAHIIVAWVKEFGTDRIGEAVYKQFLNVGLGMTDCMADWQPFNKETVRRIVWHEIGHAFSFSHSTDQNNVMYERGTGVVFDTLLNMELGVIYANDEATEYYYPSTTIVLCNGKYSIEITDMERPMGVALVDNYMDVDVMDVYYGRVTVPCGEYNTLEFKRVCEVPTKFSYLNIFLPSIGIELFHVKITPVDDRPQMNMRWDKNEFYYPDIYSDIFG